MGNANYQNPKYNVGNVTIINKIRNESTLSRHQSTNLFVTYNDVLVAVNKGNLLIKTYTLKRLTSLKKIGYFRGSIIAFTVEDVDHPFVMFEYRNRNFRTSYKTVKKSIFENDRTSDNSLMAYAINYNDTWFVTDVINRDKI